MLVSCDGFTTQVAHSRSARARHLVAAPGLGEALLALPASANHRVRHACLHVIAESIMLDLGATQGNVVRLFA